MIAALSFAVAAVLSADSARKAANLLIFVRRITRPLVIVLILLIPLQLVLGVRFANRNYNANSAERKRLAEQARQFDLILRKAQSKQDFRDLLLKQGIGVDSAQLNSMSLPEAKAQAVAVINQQTSKQIADFKLARQRRLITDLVDLAKLLFSWISLTSFFVVLQRVTKGMSLQSIDQLRRRRTRHS